MEGSNLYILHFTLSINFSLTHQPYSILSYLPIILYFGINCEPFTSNDILLVTETAVRKVSGPQRLSDVTWTRIPHVPTAPAPEKAWPSQQPEAGRRRHLPFCHAGRPHRISDPLAPPAAPFPLGAPLRVRAMLPPSASYCSGRGGGFFFFHGRTSLPGRAWHGGSSEPHGSVRACCFLFGSV